MLRTSGISSNEPPPAILWIDDEVHPTDASVRLLTLEGFRIACAESAAAGFRLARAERYSAIILDLRLPDASGLELLEHLRAGGVVAPVLVLTGYADLESAVAALRLGVVDFRWKPLMADELVAAVRALVSVGVVHASAPGVRGYRTSLSIGTGESTFLQQLVARLDAAAEPACARRLQREDLIAILFVALENAALGIAGFLACAEALKYTLAHVGAGAPASLVTRVRELIAYARAPADLEDFRVRAVLTKLGEAVSGGIRPTEYELAAELGVDPAHLGRLIRADTGFAFRQWRSAFAIRLAVQELADPDIQIAQIAFRLGYEHPSQLDREFRRTFGISPREYRRLRKSLQSRRVDGNPNERIRP